MKVYGIVINNDNYIVNSLLYIYITFSIIYWWLSKVRWAYIWYSTNYWLIDAECLHCTISIDVLLGQTNAYIYWHTRLTWLTESIMQNIPAGTAENYNHQRKMIVLARNEVSWTQEIVFIIQIWANVWMMINQTLAEANPLISNCTFILYQYDNFYLVFNGIQWNHMQQA